MTLTVTNLPFINRVSFKANKSQIEENKIVKDMTREDSSALHDKMLANYNKCSINFSENTATDEEKQPERKYYDDIETIYDVYGRDATEDAFEELIESAEDYCAIYYPDEQTESEKETLEALKEKMLGCCEKLGTANFLAELSKQDIKDNWLCNPDMASFNPMTYGEIGERLATLQDDEVMGVIVDTFRKASIFGSIGKALPIEDFVSKIQDNHHNKDKIRDILTNGLDYKKHFDEYHEPEDEFEKDVEMIEFDYGRRDCKQSLKKLVKVAKQYCKLNKEENPDMKTKEKLEQKMQEYFEKLELANIFKHFIDEKGNQLNEYLEGFRTVTYKDVVSELARINDKQTREDVTRLFASRLLSKSIDNNSVEHLVSGIAPNKPVKKELEGILTEELGKSKESRKSYENLVEETIGKDACSKTLQETIKYAEEYVGLSKTNDPQTMPRKEFLDKIMCKNVEKLHFAVAGSRIIKEDDSNEVLSDFKAVSYKDIGAELAEQKNETLIRLLSWMFGYFSKVNNIPEDSDSFTEGIPDSNVKNLIKVEFDSGVDDYTVKKEKFTQSYDEKPNYIHIPPGMEVIENANYVRKYIESSNESSGNKQDIAEAIEEQYGMEACQDAYDTLIRSSEKACNLRKNSEKSEERDLEYANLLDKMKSCCEKLGMADFYQDAIEEEGSELGEIMPDFQTVRIENMGEGLSTVNNKPARDLAAYMFGFTVLSRYMFGYKAFSKNVYKDPVERFVQYIDDDSIKSEIATSARRGIKAYKLEHDKKLRHREKGILNIRKQSL